ncbi:MAG: PHP domain-containing protein [Kiritimatiellia bacterium]
MIDLHTHSTASDGSDTPAALAQLGQRAGITVQALTDHDNVSGIAEFQTMAKSLGMIGIAGVELSAEVAEGQLHLVGLRIDATAPAVQEKFAKVMAGRADRNLEILKAFQAQQIDFTLEEVRSFAGKELVSRVHFAQALVQRGIVSSVSEAFTHYLGKGACCYRDRFRYSPEDCIALIHAAGGVAVMAHPLSLETDSVKLEQQIAHLKEAGLSAMECYYSTYGMEETVMLLRIARHLDLVPSAGSDYHGRAKPTIHLGELTVPAAAEQALRTLLEL